MEKLCIKCEVQNTAPSVGRYQRLARPRLTFETLIQRRGMKGRKADEQDFPLPKSCQSFSDLLHFPPKSAIPAMSGVADIETVKLTAD